MYAVIKSGGKQEKVEVGSLVNLELLEGNDEQEVVLSPVLLVDGTKVMATPKLLENASVKGKILGEAKGKKVRGFVYRPKARGRRRFGHRQHYSRVEITEINVGK
jgi:large subunit ribosomal protein L21